MSPSLRVPPHISIFFSECTIYLVMSMQSWIIIATILACFTTLFMITTFCVLAQGLRLYKESSRSPFKLSYSKKSLPEVAEKLERSLSKSRTRSLKSLHTYEADLAVQAEWDSRHIFERSSAFEYWWGDSKFTTSEPSGRFYTLPMFYHGSRKDCGKVGNVRNGPEKTDGMYSKHSASWAGNMDRAGGEDNQPKNDIIL